MELTFAGERWRGLAQSVATVGTELTWSRAGRQAIVMITDGLATLSRINPPRLREYLRRTDVTLEALLVTTPEDSAEPTVRSTPTPASGRCGLWARVGCRR